MRLVKIYKRNALLTLSLAFVIGTLSCFIIVTYFIRNSADHTLREYRQNIENYTAEYGMISSLENAHPESDRLTLVPIPKGLVVEESVRDTVVYSEYKEEKVFFRLMSFSMPIGEENFLVTLWQARLDAEDIFLIISLSLVVIIVLLFLLSYWMTKWFVGYLWRPFYQILEQLREVDLTTLHVIEVPKCNVNEFNILTHSLNLMFNKIHDDYIALRDLTEMTSHELQTPLSIIKIRLELLQQNEEYKEKYTEQLQSISNAVERMVRLNRFMLMIAKIKNDQFPSTGMVNIIDYIDDLLSSYESMIEIKQLEIRKQFSDILRFNLHPQMAEMLVSNLLSNAIRYTPKGEYIYIETTETALKICNPYKNVIPAGDLFVRFKKSTTTSEASGLGLTIVQSICQKNNLTAVVDVTSDIFCIQISVKTEI